MVNPYSLELNKIEVAIFFADDMNKIYQIKQWIDVFKKLNKRKKILFIVKNRKVLEWLKKNTNFVIILYNNLESLTNIYAKNNIKVTLYVNNGLRNFHSLMNFKTLHIHINHGESDKTSTISNQVKAYDYSFVVGDAGYDKYRLNLIKKDMSKFIKVGRPQLDFIQKSDLDLSLLKNKKVILYAPTWEGYYSSMNFSSLSSIGFDIVSSLLYSHDYFLIYKPHPTTGIRDKSIKDINTKIIKLIDSSDNGIVVLDGDINTLYPLVDLSIFDNSAVAIDYLIVDKPMLMTDMFSNIKDRVSKPIITKAVRLISQKDVNSLIDIIEDEIKNDTLREKRGKIKSYFLCDYDYSKQESTKLFISKIEEICKERDNLIKKLELEAKR